MTQEKEALVRQLHQEGKLIAAIGRLVGLTRKTVYRVLKRVPRLETAPSAC